MLKGVIFIRKWKRPPGSTVCRALLAFCWSSLPVHAAAVAPLGPCWKRGSGPQAALLTPACILPSPQGGPSVQL